MLLAFSSLIHAKTLMIVGDSLSAGYGMPSAQSWPMLLDHRWKSRSNLPQIINISVSGNTSEDALTSLPAALKRYRPEWVLIEIGANDGLRGYPPAVLEQNLRQMIEMIQQTKGQPLLMQIRIPRNYGEAYIHQLESIYSQLAQEYKIPLLPFFMEKIVTQPELMQKDGLHPTEEAQAKICDLMDSQLQKYVIN